MASRLPILFLCAIVLIAGVLFATADRSLTTMRESEHLVTQLAVDFGQSLQEWDGFGVNYVQLAQSLDPAIDPQDYGGLSRLNAEARDTVLDMIFGTEGLQPNIVKMFLDPFHQGSPGASYDHESTTEWMRYFVAEGVRRSEDRGGEPLEIITTLYGPPAWATNQKILRGRDLDPSEFENLARYMVSWLVYLVNQQGLPVRYLSLHNEGDSPDRWPMDASHGNFGDGHDYNAFWRPAQVAHFLEFMPEMIEAAGLDVGLTPGETTYWRNFANHWYDWAILDSIPASRNLALVTSHGFGRGNAINSQATSRLRWKRPDLHAWTTSMTWGGQDGVPDYEFVNVIRRNIYEAEVNAVIPWAVMQTSSWVGGDPNPGTAFFVTDDGKLEVRPQYYYYKQVSRFGQRGTKVAYVDAEAVPGIELLAFASNGSDHPDAFIVLNSNADRTSVSIHVSGSGEDFIAIRTSASENFERIGRVSLENGQFRYDAPPGSVTTFVAR